MSSYVEVVELCVCIVIDRFKLGVIVMSRMEKFHDNRDKKREIKGFVRDVIIAIIISVAVLFCVSPSQVKEHSMQPTVNDGDVVLLNKFFYGEPQKGDIIVFNSELKDDKGKNMKLIKRVIGLEGDKITIKDGFVYVNGSMIEEKYIYQTTTGEVENYVVPKGKVYVLGDHREVSRDSRQLGAIDKKSIVGKAFFRIFPLKKMGRIN